MKISTTTLRIVLLLFLIGISRSIMSQTFVHPGGVLTQTDLDRLKTKVAAGEHPWIDAWNLLITDGSAQSTYTAVPSSNIGGSGPRQQASKDAHAAFLNTVRWYVSGDVSYANCAVRILNAWSSTCTTASGELFQLPINNMMQAAELLRTYSGWASTDIDKFKSLALNVFYPSCHNDLAICARPASWDSPLASCIMGIGLFCDDIAKYNEAITYFKSGTGNGSLLNNVCNASGQILEMGRDMVHSNIGLSCLAEMCQTSMNQGTDDLYAYSSNRLLAGYEYYCQYNLNHPVTWVAVNDCDNDNFLGISYYNARGYLTNNPTFEMVYNHYAVLKGISAPYTKSMAQLARPETQNADFFGYGTFLYTLDATSSPFKPYAIPAAPTNLAATPGVGRIYLTWKGSSGDVANGYKILRSTTAGGSYTTISSWNNNTLTSYTDASVSNGTTYYYRVAANNQSGTSGNSNEASAQSVAATTALPNGWAIADIGNSTGSSVSYANVVGNTFVINGSGSGMGGTADNFTYVYKAVTSDFTVTAHMANYTWTWNGDKAGLVVRESLSAGAKSINLYQGETGNRFTMLQTRSATGGSTTTVGGNKFSFFPWYRIQRAGNTFTVSQSTDGLQWGVIGTSTVTMGTCYVGFGVCSGNTTSWANLTFENVTISTSSSSTISGGTYTIVAQSSNKAVDVSGGSTNDSAAIIQWTNNASANQQWVITQISGNDYKVINVNSGKAMDVIGNSTADGAKIEQRTYLSTDNSQVWTITDNGDGTYKIIGKASGKSLDVSGNSIADGALMEIWPYSGGPNQKFILTQLKKGVSANLERKDQPLALNLYPNPVTDVLTILIPGSKRAKIELISNIGTLVLSKNVEGDKGSLDMRGLSSGIYIVKISIGDEITTKRIMKK